MAFFLRVVYVEQESPRPVGDAGKAEKEKVSAGASNGKGSVQFDKG